MDREGLRAVILHPLGYEAVPRSHEPDRFQNIADRLRAREHEVLPPEQVEESDILLFDSGVWHVAPQEISPYDRRVLTHVLEHRIPVVWFDAFDRMPSVDPWDWGATLDKECEINPYSNETDWHWFARSLIANDHPLLFFMRKMQINRQYPPWVLPLEYPLFVDRPLAPKDAFLNRPYDVCGIANLSYPRAHAFIGLLRARELKADCEVRPHYRRISQEAFIARHQEARFFVEADASLGSERPMVLSTVSAMLRIKSEHRIPFPRIDLVHQVEIGDHDGWIEQEDIAKFRRVLADGDLAYSIYVQGAEFMREKYSPQAVAQYVVDEIERFAGA